MPMRVLIGIGCTAEGTKQDLFPVDCRYPQLTQTIPPCDDIATKAAVNRLIVVCSPTSGEKLNHKPVKGTFFSIYFPL